MRLVLDASVAVAATRHDEPFHVAAKARLARILRGDDELVVPAVFVVEVAASLARVGRPVDATRRYLDALASRTRATVAISTRRAREIVDIASATRLRALDAIYVWLAHRTGLPLCTLDREIVERGAAFCHVIAP